MRSMYKILTIAGSDCSGGAGIQADIKTITAHKMYAMSVICALTAQNTTGVYDIRTLDGEFVEEQLECVFTDIFPDAVKIGMVAECEIIQAISRKLAKYQPKNIVVDPVMVSTSGRRLLSKEAVEALKAEIFPKASLITPNIPEAEVLCGFLIESRADMERAARVLWERFLVPVLLKGGHLKEEYLKKEAVDCLFDGEQLRFYKQARLDNPNTHGTGCTLSSAIACNLAKGLSLERSVEEAKEYLTGAIAAGLDLGRGSGPLNHMFR